MPHVEYAVGHAIPRSHGQFGTNSVVPDSLPYLNVATGGHTTVQQLGQATAGLGWGFVATIAKTVLNSETLGFQLSQQNVDVWDTAFRWTPYN